MSQKPETLFEKLGGEAPLKALLRDFYDRVFSDLMIGFMFRKADKERLIEKEYELTARLLGAEVRYTGEPMAEVHARHRIMGGQFARRAQILKEVLADHNVPEEVREAWLSHQESLRHLITADAGGNCDPDLARRRALAYAEKLGAHSTGKEKDTTG